jgi:predicted TIM-barrel fold metal-dependent hydrolase
MAASSTTARRIPIVDAHHHAFDVTQIHYPWLVDAPIKAHFGPYERIHGKSYTIEDYRRDIANQNVVKSVHVEASAKPEFAVRETAWLQAQADRYGYPHGIVAYANLSDPVVGAVLDEHCAYPNMRGMRMMTKRPSDLAGKVDASGSLMSDAQWRKGFAALGDRGLSFDLQAPAPLMSEAAALAHDFPNVQIMLTHAGLPLDRTPEGRAAWRAGMERMAEQPNIALKVSGIPMTDWKWTVESLRPIVLESIDLFGPSRTMFGSNFPVDKLYSSYDALFDAYRQIIAGFSEAEQRTMLHDNAIRLYRL